MPLSAQKSSLSSTSGACCSGLTGSPYWMKYGLARSSSSPPRKAAAIFCMTSRSSTPAAVMTIGLVVLLTMARKHSR